MKINLPKWLQRSNLNLPDWAREVDSPSVAARKMSICIEADTNGYVAEWFKLLGVEKTTQYWLEVAYQCAKMDLQMAIENTEFDPRTAGKSAEFKFTRADEWRLTRFPKGKGIEAATQGREAREHYRRIRGRLPF